MTDGALYRRKVQIGRQATAAAVPATRLMFWDAPVLNNPLESRPVAVATGTRDRVRGHTQGPDVPTGSFTSRISAAEMDEILELAIRGSVVATTPAGATNARRRVYTPGDLAKATVELFDGARWQQGVGYSVNQLTFDGSVDGENNVSADLFGTSLTEAWAGTPATLVERSVNWLEGWQVQFYLGAFGGDVDTFVAIGDVLMAWNIQVGNALGRVYTANNTRAANRVVAGDLSVGANMTFDAVSATAAAELTAWKADTKRLLRIAYRGPEIEAGFNEFIHIDVPGAWAAPDLSGETQTVRSYAFPLSYIYDPTLGASIRITTQNARTTVF